jgi:Xaa-Pro aminopeptidase
MRMPFDGKITGATVAVTGAPAGSALTAALLKNAASAATFSIAASGTSAAGTLGTAAACAFAEGDTVSLDVLTVGSGTAGSNITVAFTVVE